MNIPVRRSGYCILAGNPASVKRRRYRRRLHTALRMAATHAMAFCRDESSGENRKRFGSQVLWWAKLMRASFSLDVGKVYLDAVLESHMEAEQRRSVCGPSALKIGWIRCRMIGSIMAIYGACLLQDRVRSWTSVRPETKEIAD